MVDIVGAVRTARANELRERFTRLAESAPTLPPPSPFTGVSGEEQKRAERWERGKRAWLAASVPDHHRYADLQKFDAADVPEYAREKYRLSVDFVKSITGNAGIFVLLGPRGAGKTWMSVGLIRETCRLGKSALYAEAMDYFLAIQETYGGRGSAAAVEQSYLKPSLLVLDAIEERADSEWNDRMLTRLINKRYAGCKTTLLISNESWPDFAARVGPTITDRIKDGGGSWACDWKSLRGRWGTS